MYDPENKGQGNDVQHLHIWYQSIWYQSISSINLYKIVLEHFSLGLTVFQDIVYFQKCNELENVGRCHDVQHLQWCYCAIENGAMTSYLMVMAMIALSLTVSESIEEHFSEC